MLEDGSDLADSTRVIFIHGLMGSSQGVKAKLLRGIFPWILTPNFQGSLEERMDQLQTILGEEMGWKIVGSSFGGLMAALFAHQHPRQVSKLVLFAPALIWPDFASLPKKPVDVPVVLYHGKQDELLPLEAIRELAEKQFNNLDFQVVDDDHGLYKTVHALDWETLLE
jgi:pimeloyl-ACP methyl ester carboxylesterase